MRFEVRHVRFRLRRYITIAAAMTTAWVAMAVVLLSGHPAHGQEESADVTADVRIAAQRLDNGEVRFGLRIRDATGDWSEPATPRAHRVDPSSARVGRWLFSSPLVLAIDESGGGRLVPVGQFAEAAGQQGRTELRIGAQLRNDGRIEFAVQQRADDGWKGRILPRVRTMSAFGEPTNWLSSTSVSITIARPSTHTHVKREAPSATRDDPITPVLRSGLGTTTLEYAATLGNLGRLESIVTVHSEQGLRLQFGCFGDVRRVQLHGLPSHPIGTTIDGALTPFSWGSTTADGITVLHLAETERMLESLRRGQSLSVRYGPANPMVVTFNLAGVFGTPIQTNIDHCGNYRQPSWRPVIDAQYGRTDAGAIYFLDRPGNTEVLGRAQVRVHGNSEATGIDGQPITLVATCRHGELSFELANLPPASGSFSVRSRIEADEWIDSAWRIITSESGWTFAPFEADYGRLRQSARVEFEIPLSPLVRVSFDLSALFSTPIQANIDNCGADPWPQMNSYVAIIQATGSVGERISYRAEPVFRADITSTPLVSTHLESWEKSELGQGGWVRLSVTCEGSNHLAVQLGNFEWDESNTSERVILEVGDHAPEASQWRVHIATKRKDKPGPYGYSLRSSDPERLVAQMRGASVVRIQIPSIGLGPVGFDIDGMFETPVQGNLDECGHYLSGETRRLRANAEACATRSGTVSEGTGKGEASYLAPSGWMAEATGLLAQAYRASAGVWSGFDPAEHQVVLAHRKSDGQVDELLTIGVFSPESLGKATPLSTAGTPFCTLVRVEELNEETLRVLNQIGTFAFQIAVGPRVSGLFVMSVDLNDDHYSPLADEVYGWSGFVMHELFHHYQDGAWAQSAALDQNFESYAYGADNLELAALEDRALRAAASAPDAKSRLEAVRHFSAVRLMRAQLIPAILHDEHQERVEGTARYLERQLDLGFAEDGSHLLRRELERVLADARLYGADRGVRAYYAFSRHYETGAAIIRLLRLFGVSNFASQIEAGKSPARVLAEYLGITQVDVERLVGEARAIYDPDGELPALAVRLAATAGKEDWVGP